MNPQIILTTSVLFPILAGLILFLFKKDDDKKIVYPVFGISLLVTALFVILLLGAGPVDMTVFELMDGVAINFRLDNLGRFFLVIVSLVWVMAGLFSLEYIKHEKRQNRFFGFYLIIYGVLIGLGCSGNLITMYAFYEFMTICSVPIVLHNQKREAIMAALKFLFYSFFGAYMALFGIYFMFKYCITVDFIPGGSLNPALVPGNETLLLVCVCLMIFGFSVKAGMFPLHAWLPAAHPVAPAPASAVLSAIIVKSGIFAILRVVFYIFGADFIRGTWVQQLVLITSLMTVFMGSLLAFREKVLKKRLAYSTVSQLSYILFGIMILNPVSLTGSLFHVIAHAFIKSALFLSVGAIIYKTGLTTIDDMKGIGKKMPVTIWCYTICSLGLIGIPPTGGFISKWYLATGSIKSGIPVFAYLGPAILLVSALLTAGYLLPVTIKGFFPGEDYDYKNHKNIEPGIYMVLPLIVLAALTLLLGIYPSVASVYINDIVNTMFNM